MPTEPTIYNVIASITNVVIAISSVFTVYIAYKALSVWKKEHETKTTKTSILRCCCIQSDYHL